MTTSHALSTHYLNNDFLNHIVNIDLALVLHTDNRPLRSMHNSIDGYYVYDGHYELLSSYQMFHVCLLRDHVHYPSMNMRNLRTFLSTNPLDLISNER